MSATRYIQAAEGRRVRHETGALLAEEGESVTWSPYWQRRLDDADVVVSAKAPSKTATEKKG